MTPPRAASSPDARPESDAADPAAEVAAIAPMPLWKHPRIRRGALALAGAGAVLAAIWWFHFRPFVTTEDARIAAPFANAAPAGAGGRIERVLVKEGDRVRAGDALVELDAVSQRAHLERARAGLRVAEARVRAAEAQLDVERRVATSTGQRARAGVESAEAAYRLAREGARREDVERARAAATAAEARQRLARRDLDRAETLTAAGAIALAELDRARANEGAARAALEEAQAALRKLETGARPDELEIARVGVSDSQARAVEANAAPARVALRVQQLEEARASQAQAAAEATAAEIALDQTTLRAPFDGVVLRVGVDPGNFVSTGQGVVTVADTAHAWVAANVEETAAGLVRPGEAVQIEVDEGGRLDGRVEVVTQTAASRFALIPADNAAGNFTKVVQRIPLRIALDAPGSRALRVGQSVVARIRVR
jgi:membrane fusion protein (multidrug efflux system)